MISWKEEIRMKKYVIFSTEMCPNCKELKDMLNKKKIEFEEMDLGSSEGLTELRINGIFTLEAPVLQVGDKFFSFEEAKEAIK